VDFVASPTSSFRPFVGALLGITLLDSSDASDAVTYATLGLHAGGFGFVGESLSVGPRIAFTCSPGLSSPVEDNSVLAVQLQLELAGWL
jgi:hypothetical protein